MNTGVYRRFKLWLCRTIGHSFDDVSVAIFKIKTSALNGDMTAEIECRRCGQVFVHKDSPLSENAPRIEKAGHEHP